MPVPAHAGSVWKTCPCRYDDGDRSFFPAGTVIAHQKISQSQQEHHSVMAHTQMPHRMHLFFQFTLAFTDFCRIVHDIGTFKSFPERIDQLPVNGPVQIAVVRNLRHEYPDRFQSQIRISGIFRFFCHRTTYRPGGNQFVAGKGSHQTAWPDTVKIQGTIDNHTGFQIRSHLGKIPDIFSRLQTGIETEGTDCPGREQFVEQGFLFTFVFSPPVQSQILFQNTSLVEFFGRNEKFSFHRRFTIPECNVLHRE